MHRLLEKGAVVFMRNASEVVTFASLRAKTDRDLIALIGSALERGFDLVEQDRAEAGRAHAEAVKLLQVVYGPSDSERRRLERKLAELRSALDGVPYARGSPITLGAARA
jgi:hypothetical protein